ncbi:solute carrier family 25 member 36-A-like isoform X2 [Convolutriloba macropyga]|uniref:solute carrier family 25 member 36-A-like isoform X2 n=1 Tax=Convolutriloba macropyga TaxID=536237 RepID=UPI003F527DC1
MQAAASCSISGGVAAMAGATVACPFDVIKTRLQSTHSYLNTQHPNPTTLTSGAPKSNLFAKPSPSTSFHPANSSQMWAAFQTTHPNPVPSSSSSATFKVPRCQQMYNAHFDFNRALSVLGESGSCANKKGIVQLRPFVFVFGDASEVVRRKVKARGKLVKSVVDKSSVVHVFRSSVKNEGFASLFKGLLPSLAAVAPSKSLYFGFYSVFKDFYTIFFPLHSHANILSASISAGFIQATTISPLFMIRTRLQLSTQRVSVKECFYEIYYAHGVSGFFRGLSATYLGLTETALYFLMYENIKWYLRREKYLSNDIDAKNSALVGISAIFSRVVATTCAYPHEVVRTRMRQVDANYSSLVDCFKRVYEREGPKGFYRGLQVELLKKVPNVAAVFIVYETLMSYFSKQFALEN